MARYGSREARSWARENLRGCCGCVMPTFTSDLSALNEVAVRHDVALERELGYTGVLAVSECGTTVDELNAFIGMMKDEVGDDLLIVHQASQASSEAMERSISSAAEAGADLVLLGYPPSFYPRSEEEIFQETKRFAELTDLGIMIFAMDLWNFQRIHPAGFSVNLLERMIEEIPNIVAIKNEVGGPGVGGISELFERFKDEVVVTDPMEMNSPAWVRPYGMTFMGTSNYEYMGDRVPAYFEMLQDPESYAAGMEIYWQLAPARQANEKVCGEAGAGTHAVHRLLWKYQGWLNGFNGGPIRGPHPRVKDSQLAALRAGAVASGLSVTDSDDAEFFVGRNPK